MPTTELEEEHENGDFWTALGGKTEYANGLELESLVNQRPPRLFQLSNACGVFNAEEVYNFNQDDLIEDDIMLLDIGTAVSGFMKEHVAGYRHCGEWLYEGA